MIDKAPFKKGGGLWHFPPRDRDVNNPNVPAEKRPTVEWRKVTVWSDTMTLVSQQRGRSAAFFLLLSSSGDTYPMFMSDAADMMKSTLIDRGSITGRWTIVKRGQNYGLKFVSEVEGAQAA